MLQYPLCVSGRGTFQTSVSPPHWTSQFCLSRFRSQPQSVSPTVITAGPCVIPTFYRLMPKRSVSRCPPPFNYNLYVRGVRLAGWGRNASVAICGLLSLDYNGASRVNVYDDNTARDTRTLAILSHNDCVHFVPYGARFYLRFIRLKC